MSLLSPLFLLGGLVAGVPVVLHLLKRHPDAVVRFSAVHLLKNAPVEHASRRRLRELLLLAFRVGAIALCALAFARPFFAASAAADGPGLIVALDTSFSMTGGGRFERARDLAVQAIDRAAPGATVGVVTFSDHAQVASPLSTDRALARAAVAAARPTVGATRYRSALTVASEALRGRTGGMVVVTDLQRSGWDGIDQPSWPDTLQLDVADVGGADANLAVIQASVNGDRIVASIRNASNDAQEARVGLAAGTVAGGEATAVGSETVLSIAPNGTADVVLPRPEGRWAVVSVMDERGPAADNRRYLVLDGPVRPQVLVVTATGDLNREAFYIQQALAASGAADTVSYDAVGVAGANVGGWDQARLASFAAVFVVSTRGLDHRGRQLLVRHLQDGGGVFMAVDAGVDGEVIGELVGAGRVTVRPPALAEEPRALVPSDVRHPVLRSFSGRASLGLATFRRTTPLRSEGCATLASFTGGEPALLECEVGAGRVLLFASDLDNRGSDFPLRATFLPFLHEAVKHLARDRSAGEYLVGAVPPGVDPVPGVVSVPRPDGSEGLAAVNVDSRESDPERLTEAQFQRSAPRVPTTDVPAPRLVAVEQEARQHLWQYALVVMLLCLVVEGTLSMRIA